LELLVVDEEESLLAALDELGDTDGPAEVAAELAEQQVVARQPVDVVEVDIRTISIRKMG
jgi:hypothetical protein